MRIDGPVPTAEDIGKKYITREQLIILLAFTVVDIRLNRLLIIYVVNVDEAREFTWWINENLNGIIRTG